MALVKNVHGKIFLGWLMIAVAGMSSFVMVRKYAVQNRKKEMEIRRQMKKKVDQELGKDF